MAGLKLTLRSQRALTFQVATKQEEAVLAVAGDPQSEQPENLYIMRRNGKHLSLHCELQCCLALPPAFGALPVADLPPQLLQSRVIAAGILRSAEVATGHSTCDTIGQNNCLYHSTERAFHSASARSSMSGVAGTELYARVLTPCDSTS